MESFVSEVRQLSSLASNSRIVQIRDHAVSHDTLHVMILMELAAADVSSLLRQMRGGGGVRRREREKWRSAVVL